MTTQTLSFNIPLDASPEEVNAFLGKIDKFFARSMGTATLPADVQTQSNTNPAQNAADTAASANAGTVTQVQTPASNTGVELDSVGVPWDARIHADSKGKNKDGSWKKRKNVDAGFHARITGELLQLQSAGTPAAGATAPAAPSAPVVATDTPAPAAPVAPPPPGAAPPPPAAPVAPAAPEAPPAPVSDNGYGAFVQLMAQNTRSDANPQGKIPADWLRDTLAYFGVPEGSLQNLAHRTDLVTKIEAHIRNSIAGL